MAEQQQDDGKEREAFQCLTAPSLYVVLQGNDARFYPMRFLMIGNRLHVEPLLLNDQPVGFQHDNHALSYCHELLRQSLT